MITLPELLEDKRYRKYLATVPTVGSATANWRIYVQRKPDGGWARKDFRDYADAYRRLRKELVSERLHDGAIQSRGIAYAPPHRIVRITKGGKPVIQVGRDGVRREKTAVVTWKPRLEASEETHTWCPYCRRPTVFRWFTNHHSLRNSPVAGIVDPSDKRCTICGAREDFVRTATASAWQPGQQPVSARKRRRK